MAEIGLTELGTMLVVASLVAMLLRRIGLPTPRASSLRASDSPIYRSALTSRYRAS
jgi:hypothetical protein